MKSEAVCISWASKRRLLMSSCHHLLPLLLVLWWEKEASKVLLNRCFSWTGEDSDGDDLRSRKRHKHGETDTSSNDGTTDPESGNESEVNIFAPFTATLQLNQ